jgi:hypothetical protein
MTQEQLDKKDLLEEYESIVDNVIHEIFEVMGDDKNSASVHEYYKFREFFQNQIRSMFPEGTEFGNF